MLQPDNFLGRLISGLWRGLVAVVGMAVVLVLLLVGFVLSLVLIVWTLLRGRRPAPVRFQWGRAGQAWPGHQGGPTTRATQDSADVVDVEVRDITSSARPATLRPLASDEQKPPR